MVWSKEQIDYWRFVYKAYTTDIRSIAIDADIDQKRQLVQREMTQLLNGFLRREVAFQDFNAVFRKKANGTWNVFHVRGFSGGMFLDKLLRYIPDEAHITQLLHVTLRLPKDIKEGCLWMQALMQFLENTIASQQIAKSELQPSRIPFFLSIWWHLQEVEQWPLPYLLAQRAILGEKESLESPIEKYFEFRIRFLSLAKELGLSSWQLEHLLIWNERQPANQRDTSSTLWEHKAVAPPRSQVNERSVKTATMQEMPDIIARDILSRDETRGSPNRSYLLWLLAKLGHKIGCQVWICATDHHRAWQKERLSELSLPSLPILAESALQPEIEQIDVLWLFNDKIVAAYEIEQAHTDVSIGLLRLFDLGTFFPSEKTHLCMIIPQDHFEKVRSELLRPIFQAQNQRQHCKLICQELLLRHAEHILRWARNVLVIDDLTSLSTEGCDYAISFQDSSADKTSLKSGTRKNSGTE